MFLMRVAPMAHTFFDAVHYRALYQSAIPLLKSVTQACCSTLPPLKLMVV